MNTVQTLFKHRSNVIQTLFKQMIECLMCDFPLYGIVICLQNFTPLLVYNVSVPPIYINRCISYTPVVASDFPCNSHRPSFHALFLFLCFALLVDVCQEKVEKYAFFIKSYCKYLAVSWKSGTFASAFENIRFTFRSDSIQIRDL